MTRQQAIFIIGMNAFISLLISLAVVWLLVPRPTSPATPPHPLPTMTPGEKGAAVPPVLPAAEGEGGAPASPTPVTYTVKRGDTLSWIAYKFDVSQEALMRRNNLANPDMLAIGQTLIIPVGEEKAEVVPPPTVGATSTPLPTATPAEVEIKLTITEIVAAGRREAEVLVLLNRGRDVRLRGWTLSNAQGQTFHFPDLLLFSGNSVRIHTTAGRNTAGDLYWGLEKAAWGPEAATVTLKDSQGRVWATYKIP